MKNEYILNREYYNCSPEEIYDILEAIQRLETLPAENIADREGTYSITIKWKAYE